LPLYRTAESHPRQFSIMKTENQAISQAADQEMARHFEDVSGRTSLAAMDALLRVLPPEDEPASKAAAEARRVARRMTGALRDLGQSAILQR